MAIERAGERPDSYSVSHLRQSILDAAGHSDGVALGLDPLGVRVRHAFEDGLAGLGGRLAGVAEDAALGDRVEPSLSSRGTESSPS